jgi:hypothetical protein
MEQQLAFSQESTCGTPPTVYPYHLRRLKMMSNTEGRAVLKLVKQEAELSQQVIEAL